LCLDAGRVPTCIDRTGQGEGSGALRAARNVSKGACHDERHSQFLGEVENLRATDKPICNAQLRCCAPSHPIAWAGGKSKNEALVTCAAFGQTSPPWLALSRNTSRILVDARARSAGGSVLHGEGDVIGRAVSRRLGGFASQA
jgi:hypothetical protein